MRAAVTAGWRARNALVRLVSGMRLHGENICPAVTNDLYQAHRSIYDLASRYAEGRVLDLGCGAGYGSHLLAEAGAAEVIGIDIDPRNVRYARRRFRHPALRYEIADAEALPPLGRFELIVASNVMEHVTGPREVIVRLAASLSTEGMFLLAVPPILDESSLRQNRDNPHHRSNLFVHEWMEIMKELFFEVRVFRHTGPPRSDLDFADPRPSKHRAANFVFEEVGPAALAGTLTAIFLARVPK